MLECEMRTLGSGDVGGERLKIDVVIFIPLDGYVRRELIVDVLASGRKDSYHL